jgi:hypothetical protein
MSRPTSTDITQIQLHTNQSAAPDLGVFQSLNVQAAAPKSALMAQGLADVLGVAMKIAEPMIERKSKKNAEQGIADATMGEVDVSRVKRSTTYAQGVEHIETKKAIFGARAAWQKHYADNVDKRLPAAAVAQEYDTFMKTQLGDLAATNPKAAAKMAPEYMRGMQELVVGHQAQLTKSHMEDATAVMQQDAADAIERGEPIEFMTLISGEHALTGDLGGAIDHGIAAVGGRAVELGRPDLLDAIPMNLEEDDGSKSKNPDFTPAHRKVIEQYRLAADAKRLDNKKVEMGLAKSEIERGWRDSIAAGIPIPWDTLMAEQKREDPFFSQDEVMSYYGMNLALENTLKDTAEFDPIDNLHAGIPFYRQEGMVDRQGEVITAERIYRVVDRQVENLAAQLKGQLPDDYPPEQLMAQAATRTTGTDAYPYRPLKATLENVPVEDTQAFLNAAKAFADLPVSQRAKYVADAGRRADFMRVVTRLQSDPDGKAAMAELQTQDPELAAQNIAKHRRGLNEEASKVGKVYLRDTISPFAENDVQVSELVNSLYAQRRINEITELNVGRSNMEPAKARELAVTDFLSTHMLVTSESGVRAFPRVANVTEKFPKAIDWLERNLTAVGKIKGVVVPPGSYLSFDPTNRTDNHMIVMSPQGMPLRPDVLRFRPQDVEQKYLKTAPDANWSDAQRKAAEETKRRAALDAFNKANPNPDLFNTR